MDPRKLTCFLCAQNLKLQMPWTHMQAGLPCCEQSVDNNTHTAWTGLFGGDHQLGEQTLREALLLAHLALQKSVSYFSGL